MPGLMPAPMPDALEEREIPCPYCGEDITLLIDASGGDQTYTEDCQVCCRPMVVDIVVGPDGGLESVRARREDD